MNNNKVLNKIQIEVIDNEFKSKFDGPINFYL